MTDDSLRAAVREVIDSLPKDSDERNKLSVALLPGRDDDTMYRIVIKIHTLYCTEKHDEGGACKFFDEIQSNFQLNSARSFDHWLAKCHKFMVHFSLSVGQMLQVANDMMQVWELGNKTEAHKQLLSRLLEARLVQINQVPGTVIESEPKEENPADQVSDDFLKRIAGIE